MKLDIWKKENRKEMGQEHFWLKRGGKVNNWRRRPFHKIGAEGYPGRKVGKKTKRGKEGS